MNTYERIIKKLNDKGYRFRDKNERGIQKALRDVANIDKDLAYSISTDGVIKKTKDLVKIAKALDTSTDYLLGLTNSDSSDLDIKAMSEYLGLSSKSLRNIWGMTLDEKKRDNINLFFEEYLLLFKNNLDKYLNYLPHKDETSDFSITQYESLYFDGINKVLKSYKYSLPQTKVSSLMLFKYYKEKKEQSLKAINKLKSKKKLTREEEIDLISSELDYAKYERRELELTNINAKWDK